MGFEADSGVETRKLLILNAAKALKSLCAYRSKLERQWEEEVPDESKQKPKKYPPKGAEI